MLRAKTLIMGEPEACVLASTDMGCEDDAGMTPVPGTKRWFGKDTPPEKPSPPLRAVKPFAKIQLAAQLRAEKAIQQDAFLAY